MKVILLLLVTILISSCGKKSGGSTSGDSPLLPAPALYEKTPMPDLQAQGLRIEYPFVICFNTAAKNYEKRLALQELLDLVYQDRISLSEPKEEYISMLNDAIRTLEKSDEQTHLCPKIYLAIKKND